MPVGAIGSGSFLFITVSDSTAGNYSCDITDDDENDYQSMYMDPGETVVLASASAIIGKALCSIFDLLVRRLGVGVPLGSC